MFRTRAAVASIFSLLGLSTVFAQEVAHKLLSAAEPPRALVAPNARPQVRQPGNPPFSGYYYETAESLACIYQIVPQMNGCDPNKALSPANNTPGLGAIVVVTPYHSPNLATDLATYSTQFQLPAPNLSVVYGNGSQAPNSCTSSGTSSYADGTFSCQAYTADPLEVAHAMAPNAKLIVVEMAAETIAGLAQAVDVANAQAAAYGGGEIVMTYEFSEASSDTALESHLNGSNVLYFAPSGYQAGLSYPGTSPNVISVGSTSISRAMANPANVGLFRTEAGSVAGAGGFSTLFTAPSYQAGLAGRLGNINKRAVPDIAATNNNNANVWVYNSGAWTIAGSEEVATGIVAGIANASNATIPGGGATTQAALTSLYSKIGTSAFFDVALGDCGAYDGNYVTAGSSGAQTSQYDLCTGLGSPRGFSAFAPAIAVAKR